MKREATDWGNISANHVSNKALVSRIYKILKLNIKKSSMKMDKRNEHSIIIEDNIQMSNSMLKSILSHKFIMEMEIKTMMRHHLSIEITKVRK